MVNGPSSLIGACATHAMNRTHYRANAHSVEGSESTYRDDDRDRMTSPLIDLKLISRLR
jgi:hypothetical protein